MNIKRQIPCLLLIGTLLLGSCENGQMTDMEGQGMELPDGKYPLDFTAVQTVPEGTPQTRVSDYDENNAHKSKWDSGEVINVQIADGNTGTYTLDGNGKPTAQTPCYWQNTQPATIYAWYSNIAGQSTETDKTVSLSDQRNGLAYVLKATANDVDYKSQNIQLEFQHQLAKVRVKPEGQQAGKVESVWVNNYTSCTVTNGDVSGNDEGYIPMRKNGEYYEANLVPMQAITAGDFIRLNDNTKATVSGITQLEAGKVYTITINVATAIDFSKGDYTISDGGTYYFTGSASHRIKVTGGNPTIYLENANINVSDGNTIDITGGNPTIHVRGDNTVSTKDGAGIYIAQNYTVTITGHDREDKLTAKAGEDGAGIGSTGGYSNIFEPSCGNISINNVTVYAYGAGNMGSSPGIGSGHDTCGKITIDNATVYAQGTAQAGEQCPAIGSGGYSSTVPTIVISGSNIYAYRSSFNNYSHADYIGKGGSDGDKGGNIQYGNGGSITKSTVYKYSYDVLNNSSSNDGKITY